MNRNKKNKTQHHGSVSSHVRTIIGYFPISDRVKEWETFYNYPIYVNNNKKNVNGIWNSERINNFSSFNLLGN